MTERVKQYLNILKKKDYRKNRIKGGNDISDLLWDLDRSDPRFATIRFEKMMAGEEPVLLEDDWFGFYRYQENIPFFLLKDGQKGNNGGHGNVAPNYARAMKNGLRSMEEEIRVYRKNANEEQSAFYDAILTHLDIIKKHCEKVRREAQKHGLEKLAKALERIPQQAPQSFYEACLFMKIIIYYLRCQPSSHITFGRFDQYMYPYFEKDLQNGVSEESLFEILELFFISINFDTDIYQGVQQGDNGQSMVLGGFDRDGNSMFNKLSAMCMDASLELNLIDPKINLRCGKNSPVSLFEYGTKLTKQGMGFPQYCNDDIAVPGLVALGYDYEDALDYVVAACWEFIVPNCAFDVPNIETFNFPLVVNRAIHQHLLEAESFDCLLDFVKKEITEECDRIVNHTIYANRSVPLLALLIDGCVEKGKDIYQGGPKYANYGCHGAGIANATDALAAIKKIIYEEQKASKETLLKALNADFVGYTELQNMLLDCPKMGNNDDYADDLAIVLLEVFSSNINNRTALNGGRWRAGTGSAMEYIISAKKCPATADGRKAETPYGCSFSPAITSKIDGPISAIQSFTKFDMRRIINGGPLTLELHDSVFRTENGEKKVAQLVRFFIERGGHQLQLNAVNREKLLDAQKHPQDYPNLIVRVWGWSGYFCELDLEYQNHIISRTEFTV